MIIVVYTTAGGARFHWDRRCRALGSGRMLSDADCGCYEFCNHRLPTTHLPRSRDSIDAARAGYTACRVCVPPALALPATGQTHGHQPVTETGYYGPEQVCARCDRIGAAPYLSALWPCTSAVVLGLVPRPEDTLELTA